MKSTYIDYAETHSFSETVIRYINNDSDLKDFISYLPNLEGFKQLLGNKKVIEDRNILVDVLTKQYTGIEDKNQFVIKNIQLLNDKNTYTITTGHQLNIFTGPLYFIYKIVTAINLAKELKQNFPEKNFVPVYWMASEDHDFDEINFVNISGKKVQWNIEAKGATGRLKTEKFEKTLKEYLSVLGISQNANQLSGIIKAAYSQPKLSSATRYLVNALFSKYGLVVLDADDIELKKQFSSIIEADILQQNSFHTISSSISELKKINIQAQVNPREINFFYLLDNLRERIVYDNEVYSVLNSSISFTEQALKEEINSHPERFSPNVVMRPLYQEFILPNLAYIGGGAEIVYWLELKKTFDLYTIDFPILILRNSALIADQHTELKLNRLNVEIKELFTEIELLKKIWVQKNNKNLVDLKPEYDKMESIFNTIKLQLSNVDQTLIPSTDAVNTRLKRALNNLKKKIIKAEKRKFSDALNQLENIKYKLFPGGSLQERSENFGSFYVKYGDDFIEELINSFHPLDFKFTILS